MWQQAYQSKKWLLALAFVVVTAVLIGLWVWQQTADPASPHTVSTAAPGLTALNAAEDTSPLPEIDSSLINCSNWIRLEMLEPGGSVTGPAVIFPYIAPRELALALGVKWRPRWGISIFADQTVVIPESVIDSSTGEMVLPDGNVRYFTDDVNLAIAEVSRFAEECT